MKRRPSILIVCSLMAAACGISMPVAANPQSHGVTQAQIDSLAEIMNQAVEQEQIAGGSFLVVHKGEVVFQEAFGYADIEAKRPFTTEELLPVASISKPFLGSVMMALVDQGKLKLDDPVEKFLPEFKGKKVKGSQSPARPMTVRHLLSHTGGFWANQQATPEMRRAIFGYRRPLSEAVSGIAKFDLMYEPGTKIIYSGAGHCVAGRVAEVALGDQSLEKIAQDVLFRPLGLNRTTYLPSQETRKAAPGQYLRVKGKLKKQPVIGETIDVRLIRPGASLFTTLDDIAALGQMHLNDGVYNGKRILSKESVTEMRRLHSPEGSNRNYGLCWNRDDVSEEGLADLVYHGGARGGLLIIDRRRETLTVFLAHSESGQVQQINEDLNQQVKQIFPVANDR